MVIPVLLIVHRRPEVTAVTLQRILEEEPSRLYIAGDAPRQEVKRDAERVKQTWNVIEKVAAGRIYAQNLREDHGGKYTGIKGAIDWFFEQERQGVIIDEDILIGRGSLKLSSIMLENLKHDKSVGSICLYNEVPQSQIAAPADTYRLSQSFASGFWGTWASRWAKYIDSMDTWRENFDFGDLRGIGSRRYSKFYERRLDTLAKNGQASWEVRWLMTHWANNWLVARTNSHFAGDLGYTPEATNNTVKPRWEPGMAVDWDGRWCEASKYQIDEGADRWTENARYGLSFDKKMKRQVRKLLQRKV